MTIVNWTFYGRNPSNQLTLVKPIVGGNLSYDDSRTTVRTLTGLAWTPAELAKISLVRDDLLVYLAINGGTPVLMGTFKATSSSYQKDALTYRGVASDIAHIDFSDVFVQLNASSPSPIIAVAGLQPDQIMGMIADKAGLDHAFAGSSAGLSSTVTWAPFTTLASILGDLAVQAGQRPPWADRNGVARSVAANVIETAIIDLATFKPEQGTIVITENYLTAPDEVVVYDQQALTPVVGVWDAPSAAPNSAFNRGYSIAVGVAIQGLASASQGNSAAQAYGEQQSARTLAASCDPKAAILLDGPQIISYDSTNWIIRSWSIGTAVGSSLQLSASEVVTGT